MTEKKVPVYKLDGSQSGEMELPPAIFEATVNKRLLQLALVAYAGNQRRGTHDTKERKEVSGGGKKPWRQKGTGRARQGSTRAPQWRGGGTVFGPTPRDYDTKLSQAMREQALISALSSKRKEEHVMVIESMDLSEAKTKGLVRAIKAWKLDGVRTVCVVAQPGENLKRASRNLHEIFLVKRPGDLNAYHVMRRRQFLIEKAAITLLEKRLLESSKITSKKELIAT